MYIIQSTIFFMLYLCLRNFYFGYGMHILLFYKGWFYVEKSPTVILLM